MESRTMIQRLNMKRRLSILLFGLAAASATAFAGVAANKPAKIRFTAALSSAAASQPSAVANPFLGASRSAAVLFVPLDVHARQVLQAVAPRVDPWMPPGRQVTAIATANPVWITNGNAVGPRNAYAIVTDMYQRFRQAQGGRPIFLMTVTSEAVYSPQHPEWGFAFGYYVYWGRSQVSAVYGTRPMRVFQPEREKARLTKMMLRYIGAQICGLPRNSNPRSVMYEPLLSTEDLDRMTATLPARCRR
jgi:hypothetical protein